MFQELWTASLLKGHAWLFDTPDDGYTRAVFLFMQIKLLRENGETELVTCITKSCM